MPSPNAKKIVTAANAMFTFYDIESLANVFTVCCFTPRTNVLHAFYLVEEGCVLAGDLASNGGFDQAAAKRIILDSNPAYQGTPDIRFHDLATLEANLIMATIFGLSDADPVNDPKAASSYDDALRPTCDTDRHYDPFTKHPYLAGYNSYNYDTTMLAVYFMEAMAHVAAKTAFQPASPAAMRGHNDELFTEAFKSFMPRYLTQGRVAGGQGWKSLVNRIRAAMIDSGRHLDVARLNEKQQRVGLKRLLGMMGHQILESDKLSGHNAVVKTADELYELLAYNVSDVVYLDKLFQHPTYAASFDLKKALMDEYPETVYQQVPGKHVPDVKPWRIRRGRLTPDSTSAKFVSYVLSPYGALKDIEAVSFLYPSEKVAAERGIERVNVLDESRKFFYESISSPAARAQFDLVYDYYRSIEGSNFNTSEGYVDQFKNKKTGQLPVALRPKVLADVPKSPNNLPYFRADGSPTSCFATFSTGGIHGAEADLNAYATDFAEYVQEVVMLNAARTEVPDAKDLIAMAKAQAGDVVLPDGSSVDVRKVVIGVTTGKPSYRKVTKNTSPEVEEMLERAQLHHPDPADLVALADLDSGLVSLPSGTTVSYKKVLSNVTLKNAEYRDRPTRGRPVLFVDKADGSTKLHGKYVYTSADEAIHEDFASYYPLLLSNMSAFYNPDLGEDRYLKLFHQKESLGKQMKAPGLDSLTKQVLGISRNGVKLLLNAASGAGDAAHDNSIRMNNQIISMRIIGQLFSWRIGQAQTLAGARIISTNTDGLYSVLDEATNNAVLAQQMPIINVDIEPEPMILVSKDSNNRLELKRTGDEPWQTKVIGASGGSLSCFKGPNPEKSLAHPAVMDYVLAEYLRLIAGGYQPHWSDQPLAMDAPFDHRLGLSIIHRMVEEMAPVQAAMMFQNILAASVGSITYPFASDAKDEEDDGDQLGAALSGSSGSNDTVDVSKLANPRPLQHYNRVFVVKPGVPGAVNLHNAGAWKITTAMINKRNRDGSRPREINPVARDILFANGWTIKSFDVMHNNMTMLPSDQDVVVRKISGIDSRWPMLVLNRDLHNMDPQHLQMLIACLDLDVYNEMVANAFEANWRNKPHFEDGSEDGDDTQENDAA
jgi:hypothetical protein